MRPDFSKQTHSETQITLLQLHTNGMLLKLLEATFGHCGTSKAQAQDCYQTQAGPEQPQPQRHCRHGRQTRPMSFESAVRDSNYQQKTLCMAERDALCAYHSERSALCAYHSEREALCDYHSEREALCDYHSEREALYKDECDAL